MVLRCIIAILKVMIGKDGDQPLRGLSLFLRHASLLAQSKQTLSVCSEQTDSHAARRGYVLEVVGRHRFQTILESLGDVASSAAGPAMNSDDADTLPMNSDRSDTSSSHYEEASSGVGKGGGGGPGGRKRRRLRRKVSL